MTMPFDEKWYKAALRRREELGLPPLTPSDDYRDVAARHHIDCVCAACERAQYEEKLQHLAVERREVFADAVFDPKLWFEPAAAQYGYIADTDPVAWDDLVTWLVANPCDSEQSRATKLIAAFIMRRKA